MSEPATLPHPVAGHAGHLTVALVGTVRKPYRYEPAV